MTSTPQHTPAPWFYQNEMIYSKNDPTRLPIAQVFEIHIDDNTAGANARLIVAAPDLLIDLEHALTILKQVYGTDEFIRSAEEMIAHIHGKSEQ